MGHLKRDAFGPILALFLIKSCEIWLPMFTQLANHRLFTGLDGSLRMMSSIDSFRYGDIVSCKGGNTFELVSSGIKHNSMVVHLRDIGLIINVTSRSVDLIKK